MGTHVFGLILKAIYYRYKHPWMSLSDAYKILGLILEVVLTILGSAGLLSLPIIGYFLSKDSEKTSTTSTVLYILTGLCILFVSTHQNFLFNLIKNNNNDI